MLRLGYTESTLLYYFFLETILKINNFEKYEPDQANMINWLLSTSGYYDKSIKGTYFKYDSVAVKRSNAYSKYFFKLLDVIKKYPGKVYFNFHELGEEAFSHKPRFISYISNGNNDKFQGGTQNREQLYEFMRNKRVLVVNNLGKLFKQQYESGNLKKIYDCFPQIDSLEYFNNGYSFVNSGPHNDLFQTLDAKFKELGRIPNNYNAVVISAGAYSLLFAEYFIKQHKQVFILGGTLPLYFGVRTKRDISLNGFDDETRKLFIDVPKEMIPENANKVEDGCYW